MNGNRYQALRATMMQLVNLKIKKNYIFKNE